MNYELNQKFVVINEKPYDNFTGHNETPAKFIEIEIIEIKTNVPGEFDDKKTGTGYIGKGSDGYFYGYDFPYRNQGFGNTQWERYCSNEDFKKLSEKEKDLMIADYMWYDITQFQCPADAIFCKDKEYISYCKKHQHHFYTKRGCFRCLHNMKAPKITMNLNEHNWVGWY